MTFQFGRFGEHAAALKRNGKRLDRALADGLRPPPKMNVSEWAPRYRRFPTTTPIRAAGATKRRRNWSKSWTRFRRMTRARK
jgi:hypothetical protein